MITMSVSIPSLRHADHNDYDLDEANCELQGGCEELCGGVQEQGLLQDLWIQVLGLFIFRPFFTPMHYCLCSVNHGKDLFVATIILSESEFLGENCHLSELAEEGEEENQLKVS